MNWETTDGQRIFKKLVKKIDLVLESFPPGYMDKLGLSYLSLSQVNPRVIMVSITPFGQAGPYKDYKGCDIVAMAMGGVMHITGYDDRPPLRVSVPQAEVVAGIHGAIGVLMALEYRARSGQGQHVDVSTEACVARLQIWPPVLWAHEKLIARRDGIYYGDAVEKYRPQLIWACKDGYMGFIFHGGSYAARRVYPLIEWMIEEKVPDIPANINWHAVDVYELSASGTLRQVEKVIGNFLLNYTKAEIMEQGAKRGFTIMPVNSPSGVLNDAQLSSRDFWEKVEHDELGKSIIYPGAPCKLSQIPWRIRRRAPLIGEHNMEIYSELGFSPQEVALLREANTI